MTGAKGETGATGAAGTSTESWMAVQTATYQATSNSNYLVDKASQVTITLPSTPTVGDIIKIVGLGSGGWKIAQNSTQFIMTNALSESAILTAHNYSKYWHGVASSADGSKLVAVAGSAPIYVSADAGLTWSERDSSRSWTAIASSSDGVKLVATVSGGQIYTSSNAGLTWTARDSSRNWGPVVSSADGVKLASFVEFGQVYTSIDSGQTWTARDSSRSWTSIASSADGSKLVATAIAGGQIYTSSDAGANWTARESARNWFSVASSADGATLVALDGTSYCYVSIDSGVSWTAKPMPAAMLGVALSADASKLIVNGNTSTFESDDLGNNWFGGEHADSFYKAAISSDGSKMIGVKEYGGLIYTTSHLFSTEPGTSGSISGGQFSTISLQYAGSGRFVVLGHNGIFDVE